MPRSIEAIVSDTAMPKAPAHPATEPLSFARRGAALARRAAARLVHVGDPFLHSMRRRRAAERLPPDISTVLVICYGNICRSPYAAAVLAKALEPAGILVQSAGFYGPNRPCPDVALTVARQRRLDLDRHRSRLVDAKAVLEADLIVGMEPQHLAGIRSQFAGDVRRLVLLGDFDPDPIVTRAIPDPYGGSADVFDGCYERIERCADRLAALVRASRSDAGAQNHPRAR